MLDAWQVVAQPPFGESVCRVLGGPVRRCVLTGESDEMVIDVVEVRVVPQHFEGGCRRPAHGTVTVDVRSDLVRHALTKLARSREAVVLQRPDGGALEMRFCELATARCEAPAAGSAASSTVTFGWHAP